MAVHLEVEDVSAIDLAGDTSRAVSPADVSASTTHVPLASPHAGFALIRCLERLRREHGRIALVSGQDIGTLQRLAFTWAARRQCPTALMPDGIVSEVEGRQGATSSVLGRLRAASDRAGVLGGDPVGLGRSNPDLILSWGEGWNTLWRARAPSARIVVTGSPRSDALLAVDGRSPDETRVLLCSQPLWQMEIGADTHEVERWYRWLAASAAGLENHADVRVRLHPAELGQTPRFLDTADLDRFVRQESVAEALAWASHVIAPASTISLESAAVGRSVALVEAANAVASKWAASPLFADAAWTRLTVDRPLEVGALHVFQSINTERYLTNVGRSARAVANALRDRFG